MSSSNKNSSPDKEYYLKLNELEANPFLDWPDDASETINRALDSEQINIRHLGIRLAGHIGDDIMISRLLDIAADGARSLDDRMAALFSIRASIHQSHVIGSLGTSPEPATGTIALDKLDATLYEFYQRDDLPEEIRRTLFFALADIGERTEELVAENLGSEIADRRAAALIVISQKIVVGYDDEILKSLRDEAPQVQLTAIFAAMAGEVLEAEEIIVDLAFDPSVNIDVRTEAIKNLVPILGEKADEILKRFAQSPILEFRDVAEDALDDLYDYLYNDDDYFDDEDDVFGYDDEDDDDDDTGGFKN